MSMFERLEDAVKRYEELGRLISDPAVIARQREWREYVKEHAHLEKLVGKYNQRKKLARELEEAREMAAEEVDQELKELAEQEVKDITARLKELDRELKILLLPRDPMDDKNVVVEIRAGAGGEEAALFAGDLFRMYLRYAERQGWRTEVLSSHETDIGGFKEVIFVVEGDGAYSRLKFESGVHRVQRIPATESGGRIHTSTATVAVLPEAEEVDVEINPEDLQIDTFCASGPGGQHVNKTESAVRITHLPTGLVVTCQDEKSQHKNRAKAMRVLRARLLQLLQEQQHAELAAARRAQVGTGDRSERIRTYNFPQNRVTDHRVNLTLHRLHDVLEGDIDELVEALIAAEQVERLKRAE